MPPYLPAFPQTLSLLRLVASTALAATRRQPHRALVACASPSTRPQYLVSVLLGRGLLDDVTGSVGGSDTSCSDDVGTLLGGAKAGVYCGFDPTADSLHLGNLVAIMTLVWCQRCGHKPVAIVGGATGRVGDPIGKSAKRPVLSEDVIRANLVAFEKNIRTVLDCSGRNVGWYVPEVGVRNNDDWWAGMSFLDVVGDVGKYLRVGSMLGKESVENRLESEDDMIFTAFTYQMLQAYDFMHLSDVADVRVQMGGSEQWGSITAGMELTRKLRHGRALHGITFPLLTTADRRKFGKSDDGAVWLTADKL